MMSETTVRNETRYIVMELSDAKLLASVAVPSTSDKRASEIINRIDTETGADIEEIVNQLKGMNICHACVVENQEQSCESIQARQLGRRLSRLLDRANHDKE